MPKVLSALQAIEIATTHAGDYSGWVGLDTSVAEVKVPTDLAPTLPIIANTALDLAQAVWHTWHTRLPLTSVELSQGDGPTAYLTQTKTWLIIPGQFSAAHRTYAPRLTEAENRALYGKCANLHGHNYRAEMALPPHAQWPGPLWDEFDHVNLSADISDLSGRNVVTEAVAELITRRAPEAEWVRVWELPDFFAEYHRGDASYRLGRAYPFRAGNRLATLSVVVRGQLDPQTETAYDLGQLDRHCLAVLQELDDTPAVSAALTRDLWSDLADRLGEALTTLHVEEAHKQRFRLSESYD